MLMERMGFIEEVCRLPDAEVFTLYVTFAYTG